MNEAETNGFWLTRVLEESEDTKGVKGIRKQKDRKHNGQKRKD